MPLAPGHTLAQYRITAALGAGGMGEVYRATDPKLGRDVGSPIVVILGLGEEIRAQAARRPETP